MNLYGWAQMCYLDVESAYIVDATSPFGHGQMGYFLDQMACCMTNSRTARKAPYQRLPLLLDHAENPHSPDPQGA